MTSFRTITQGKGRWILEQMGFPAQFMRKKHGPCPMCGGKDRYRFTDYKRTGGYICNQCTPQGGDFASLAMAYFDLSFKDLARQVESILGVDKQPKKHTKKEAQMEDVNTTTAKFLDRIRAECLPATPDSPPALYLRKRGITIPCPPTIRYLPSYLQDGKPYPCLIARLDNPDGERVSYKIIHLTPDGDKAPVEIVKKTLPCEREFNGSAIRLFKPENGILAIAEGIETALAYTQRNGYPCWSVDNAHNMTHFLPPSSVTQLIIVADTDPSFTGQAAAFTLANSLQRQIQKPEATLKSVSVVLLEQSDEIIETTHAPTNGLDYNDLVIEHWSEQL